MNEEGNHGPTPGVAETRKQTPLSRLRNSVEILALTVFIALFLKTFVIEAYRIPTGSMEDTLLVGDFLLVNKFVYGATTPRTIPFTDAAIPFLRLPALKSPKRGDVVVFEFPQSDRNGEVPPVNYVKRCVAIPGDTVRIVNKQVIVNGAELALPRHAKVNPSHVRPREFRNYRIFPRGAAFNEDNYGPLTVPRRGEALFLDVNTIAVWWQLIEREGHRVEVATSGEVLIDRVPTSEYVVEHEYYFVMGDNRDNSLDSRFWGFVPETHVIGQALAVYWSWDEPLAGSGLLERFSAIRWSRIGSLIR